MMKRVQLRHVHLMAGVVLLCLLPIGSAFGSGFFSWTMYSGSGEYRIDIHVKDASGRWHAVAPTGLADAASPAAGDLLVGADHFRRGPTLTVFRAHLEDFARFVCRERAGASVEVVLRERRDGSGAEHDTTARVDCR